MIDTLLFQCTFAVFCAANEADRLDGDTDDTAIDVSVDS